MSKSLQELFLESQAAVTALESHDFHATWVQRRGDENLGQGVEAFRKDIDFARARVRDLELAIAGSERAIAALADGGPAARERKTKEFLVNLSHQGIEWTDKQGLQHDDLKRQCG